MQATRLTDGIRKIKDLMNMISNNWVDIIGKQSMKSLKYKKSLKIPKLALEKDILTVSEYIKEKYDKVINHLRNHPKE